METVRKIQHKTRRPRTKTTEQNETQYTITNNNATKTININFLINILSKPLFLPPSKGFCMCERRRHMNLYGRQNLVEVSSKVQ